MSKPLGAALDNLADLIALPNWVVWRLEPNPDGPKPKKMPYAPVSGRLAKADDPTTWGTFDQAVAAYTHGGYEGIGFEFGTPGHKSGYTGVDLDGCIGADGVVAPWAQEAMYALASYSERSQSGYGVHILVKGALPPGGRKKGAYEMYDSGRFFALTGDLLNDAFDTICERQAELTAFHAQVFGTPQQPNAAPSPTSVGLDDAHILELAAKAKNGAMFDALWHGDLAGHGDDHSAADLALCSYLAFYCGGDPTQVDRLFRASGLYRPKWDSSHYSSGQTYGAHTVAQAIAGCSDFYRGNGHSPPDGLAGLFPTTTQADEPEIWETDAGNGARFAQQYGQDARWCEPLGGWHIWDGKRWALDTDERAMALAKATAREIRIEAAECPADKKAERLWKWARASENKARLEAMLALARSEPGMSAKPEQFDADPWVLNCDNGILDLRTGTLHPHDRAAMCSKLAPVSFDPQAQASRWIQFMREITLDDDALAGYLQRKAGQYLTGDTSERSFALFYGVGHNGKSTYCNIQNTMLGDYANPARIETFLAEKRTSASASGDRARLAGARLVVASEIPQGRDLDEQFIKDVTGHTDPLVARHLYSREFTFMPTFKLILFGNHKPGIKGTDQGIWGRVHLVPFLARFEGKDADKHLDEKLHGELSGILNWALEGCLAWQQDGLQPPEAVSKATSAYRNEEDLLGTFIEDRCVIRPLAHVSKADLKAAYLSWCASESIVAMSQRDFSKTMTERGFNGSLRIGTAQTRSWGGIELMETPLLPDTDKTDKTDVVSEKSLKEKTINLNNRENGNVLSVLSTEDAPPDPVVISKVVPAMMTQRIRRDLAALGYSERTIDHMSPGEAWVLKALRMPGSMEKQWRSLGMSTSLPDNTLKEALDLLVKAGLAHETASGWRAVPT